MKKTCISTVLISCAMVMVSSCSIIPAPEASIYDDLGNDDVTMASATMQDILQHGQRGDFATWTNPESGHTGAFEVGQTFVARDGSFCRGYVEIVRLADGRSAQFENRACMSEDGIWQWI